MAVALAAEGVKAPPSPASTSASPLTISKNIATDPGIIYTSADALMFATTNVLGFVACLGAVGVAATLKALDTAQPQFLRERPQLAKIAFDDRTPLRVGGLALLVVGGASLATGAMLPAAASIFLAIANFRIADSITRQDHTGHKKVADAVAKPVKPSVMSLLFKRPDLYLNVGFACAGLMAGGAALFILPLVGVAFCVGVTNVMQGRPEHAGHPKMITAMSALAFAGIGLAEGHKHIAAAHMINGMVIAEFERRITPGGSMLTVMKESFGTLGRFVTFSRREKPQNDPGPQLVPVPDSKPGKLDTMDSMQDFNDAAGQKTPGTSPKPADSPTRKKRTLRDFSA